MIKVDMFINGKFVESLDRERKKVINPATEEEIATLPMATVDDVDEAVDAAYEAQKRWEKVPSNQRGKLLKKIAQKLREKKDIFSQILSNEVGKPIKEARDEVEFTAEYYDYFAEWARRIEGEIIPSDRQNENIYLFKSPIGVVAGIVPWNYPLFVMARKIAPALIAGDSVVIKPSSNTPINAYEMFKLFEEVELPKGIVNLVTGSGHTVGKALASNKKVSLISVTGSVETGIEVIKNSANNITKVSLELGGKAPAIVMDDAKLDDTVTWLKTSRLTNAGQLCNAAERIYVHEKIAEKFTSKMVSAMAQVKIGYPLNEDTEMGPLVSKDQLGKVSSLVGKGKEQGGIILLGGKRNPINGKGYYYLPTVVSNVAQDNILVKEEIFGPVMPIITFSSLDEAIEMANNSEYGLTSSIYTTNVDTAMKAINSLKFGETYVNREHFEAIQGFHAGWRKSGLGGDDGKHGLDEFLKTRVIYFQYKA